MTQKIRKSLQRRIFIQTFSALNPAEKRSFKVFCQQASNISERTKKLFVFIYQSYPKLAQLTEAEIHTRFFRDTPKANIQLNYALHDLQELLQQWMIQQELQEDRYLQNRLFLRACQKRHLHQQFFKKAEQTLAFLEEDTLDIPNTWYQQFEISFAQFYHSLTPKNEHKVESLDALEANLDLFYYGSKLRQLCQKIYRRQHLQHLPSIDPIERQSILEFAKEKSFDIPFFKLYFLFIQYVQGPNEATFERFIQSYREEYKQLARLDQALLLSLTIYSFNAATMSGNQQAAQTQFDLFQFAFKYDLVLFDNEMSDSFFNNFLVAACTVGAFEIAEKRLKKYQVYFRPAIREDFTNLMWCTLYYLQGKYDKVELGLEQFQFKNPAFRIRSRNLRLKAMYENYQQQRTWKQPILAELVNFKKYIYKQSKLTLAKKNSYYVMIKVIRKLTNVRHQRSGQRRKMQQELLSLLQDESVSIMSKKWLLEKVHEL